MTHFSNTDSPSTHSEQLELFHSDGTPVGAGISREVAHSEGILHGASHIIIRKWEQDRLYVLLQRRSLNKDSYPGCLDISSAGHIERGSDFLDTAMKELQEELGLTVRPEELTELFTQSITHEGIFHGKPFLDREINKVYLLDRTPQPEELTLQKEELSQVLWMPADEILARLAKRDSELCLLPDEFQKAVAIIRTMDGKGE